jgi:hypothetical protein
MALLWAAMRLEPAACAVHRKSVQILIDGKPHPDIKNTTLVQEQTFGHILALQLRSSERRCGGGA